MAEVRENERAMKSELVAALYATPGTILIGAAMVATVMAAATALTGGDASFASMTVAMLAIGLVRQLAHRRFLRVDLARASEAEITRLERLAMVGAWSTAALIAAFGSHAVLNYTY